MPWKPAAGVKVTTPFASATVPFTGFDTPVTVSVSVGFGSVSLASRLATGISRGVSTPTRALSSTASGGNGASVALTVMLSNTAWKVSASEPKLDAKRPAARPVGWPWTATSPRIASSTFEPVRSIVSVPVTSTSPSVVE